MEFIKLHEKNAVIYDESPYTYREVLSGIKSLERSFKIEKGDRVVIFMENRPEFIYSFFAVWDCRGINVCLDSGLTSQELEYYLNDCRPKYIFTSQKNFETAKKAVETVGISIKIILVDELKNDYEGEDLTVTADDTGETALILYTSGTTGNPKGVMLTVENIMANVEGLDRYQMYQSADIVLALLPLHHVFPLLGTIVVPLYKGATVVFLKELSAQAMMDAFKKYNITFMLGVPRLWESIHAKIMEKINSSKITKGIFKIMELVGNEKLSKIIFKKVHKNFGEGLRFFVSGGSKLDPQISKDFLTLGLEVCEGYGLTETSPMISFTPINEIVPGSAGKMIWGIQYKFLDDGELLVKGANLMKGYYNKPEATAEAIDSEGWFHTGDLAELRDGYLYITGRKKEMIVLSNGKKINPNDMETELVKSSVLIKEAAVMEYNSKLTAIIFPDLQKAKDEGIVNIKEKLKWEVIDRYNIQAPNYKKILDTVIVTEELPKTRLGKIQRFKLKEFLKKLENGASKIEKKSTVVEPEGLEYEKIKAYLKKIHPEAEIFPDAHTEIDIGMDSLDNVELLSYIESTFGIVFAEEELAHAKTVREIAELVKKKGGQFHEGETNWKKFFNITVVHHLPQSNWLGLFSDRYIFRPIFHTYFHLKLRGGEKIGAEPTLFIGNHQSMLDGFAFSQILSKKIRNNTYYLGTSEHFNSPFRKWIADRSNVIVVDYDRNIKETLQVVAQVLKNGKNVVIFPEGARTRDGKLQEFKKSFAILAHELNIPITLFGIKGAYELMPTGKKFPKSGKFQVTVLDIFYPEKKTVEEIVEISKGKISDFINGSRE